MGRLRGTVSGHLKLNLSSLACTPSTLLERMGTGAPAVKRRRIVPQAVQDDELPITTLPTPDDAGIIVAPPDPGRRIWVDISQSYEINFAKVFKAAGGKPSKAVAEEAPGTDTLRMPGEARKGESNSSRDLHASPARVAAHLSTPEIVQRFPRRADIPSLSLCRTSHSFHSTAWLP